MQKTIILNAGKCSWGRCIFCGWGKHDYEVNAESLIKSFNEKVDESVTSLKVFGSGSFLDQNQFPLEFLKHAAKIMQAKELIVESRPEHITKENLALFKGVKLTVAIGLEAADDEVLKKLRKGITINQFINACKLVHDQGFRVKAYILVNPPFDYPGLLDKTVDLGLKNADELVLINTYPHAKAELFDYWIRGEWKPINEAEFNDKVKKYADKRIKFDFDNYSFEPRFPQEKQERLVGVGLDYLLHPYFNVWQDYITRFYKKPIDKTIALFLPCSKRKPYFKSQTHKFIRRMIAGFPFYKKIHLVVISNPGVIPVEFSDKYPFNSYDWNEINETPEIKKTYIKLTEERVINYLRSHQYDHYLAYFKPDSESGIALKQAFSKMKIKFFDLCDEGTYKKLKDKRNPLIDRLMLQSMKLKLKGFSRIIN